jgi:kinesin family protein 15
MIFLRFVTCLTMDKFVTYEVNLPLWHLLQACQREEDAQHTKMMLRFREEKIKQLELLVHSKLSSEKYLMEENKALLEEIQLVRARTDRNPELTRFALENIRLHEQLQL